MHIESAAYSLVFHLHLVCFTGPSGADQRYSLVGAGTTVESCEVHAVSIGANAVNYNAADNFPAVRCQLRNCSQPVAPAWSVPYWRGYATFALPPPPPPAPPPPGALDRVLLTEAASRDGAVCLDGTPAAYYWRSGSGSGKNSWVLFLEGGGWCAGLGTAVGGFDSCLSRSHGGLGSSASYSSTMTLGEGAATWSADPKTSAFSFLGVCCDDNFCRCNPDVPSFADPRFWNWNVAYAK